LVTLQSSPAHGNKGWSKSYICDVYRVKHDWSLKNVSWYDDSCAHLKLVILWIDSDFNKSWCDLYVPYVHLDGRCSFCNRKTRGACDRFCL
jgi:hypothetical protein